MLRRRLVLLIVAELACVPAKTAPRVMQRLSEVATRDAAATDDRTDENDADANLPGDLWVIDTVAQCAILLDDSLCRRAPDGVSDAAKNECRERCESAVTKGIAADSERAVADCMDRVLMGDGGSAPECRFLPTNRVLEGRAARCVAECEEWIARTRRPVSIRSAPSIPSTDDFPLPPPPPPPR